MIPSYAVFGFYALTIMDTLLSLSKLIYAITDDRLVLRTLKLLIVRYVGPSLH
ncbi:MAG: Uncharacterised protein [Porticoccaceae bacterium UBA1117]|nr:MAG: Uncharacterised protein [Porticoccaceae bacterium UBA1117]